MRVGSFTVLSFMCNFTLSCFYNVCLSSLIDAGRGSVIQLLDQSTIIRQPAEDTELISHIFRSNYVQYMAIVLFSVVLQCEPVLDVYRYFPVALPAVITGDAKAFMWYQKVLDSCFHLKPQSLMESIKVNGV